MNQPALKHELEWSMVHPEILDQCWDECAKLLKRSVKRSGGRVTINDVYRDVDSGRCQMWIVYDTSTLKIIGCIVTFLKEYPTNLRMLHIDHISGGGKNTPPFLKLEYRSNKWAEVAVALVNQ